MVIAVATGTETRAYNSCEVFRKLNPVDPLVSAVKGRIPFDESSNKCNAQWMATLQRPSPRFPRRNAARRSHVAAPRKVRVSSS